MEELLHPLVELGPTAEWIVGCCIGLVAVFVLYLGIAMRATLYALDPKQQQIRYQIFRDLLELFLRGRRH